MTITQNANPKTLVGDNFTAIYTGPLSELDSYKLAVPGLDRPARGKLFIRELTKATAMQISINKLPAGKGSPFYHKHHENEETYLFIKGQG